MRFLAPLLLATSFFAGGATATAADVEILKAIKNGTGTVVSYTVHTYKNGNLYGGKVFDAETGYLKCYDVAEVSKDGKLMGTKIFAPDGEMLARSLFIFNDAGTVKETRFLLPNNVEIAEGALNTLIENRFAALMKPATATPALSAPATIAPPAPAPAPAATAAPAAAKSVSTPP